MIEFFKILIEEPGKQRKFGVFLIKVVLNIILSVNLYFYSTDESLIPMDITVNAIFDFIISGRFLIFCLLYITSHFILFGFLDTISLGVLSFLYKKITPKFRLGKEERNFVNKVLSHFELIIVNEKEKTVSAGKNTDGFYEFMEGFTNKENKDEIISLKNSLVNDIAHTFFVFVLIYYSCIDIELNNNFINGLIITGAIIIPLLYFIANGFIDFLNNNAKSISFELQRLRLQRNLDQILDELGLLSFDFTSLDPPKFDKVISFKNKDHRIEFRYLQRPMLDYELNSLKEKYVDKGQKVVLISNTNMEAKAQDIADEYKMSIYIIKYNSEHDLKDKIAGYFKNK